MASRAGVHAVCSRALPRGAQYFLFGNGSRCVLFHRCVGPTLRLHTSFLAYRTRRSCVWAHRPHRAAAAARAGGVAWLRARRAFPSYTMVYATAADVGRRSSAAPLWSSSPWAGVIRHGFRFAELSSAARRKRRRFPRRRRRQRRQRVFLRTTASMALSATCGSWSDSIQAAEKAHDVWEWPGIAPPIILPESPLSPILSLSSNHHVSDSDPYGLRV